MIICNQLCEWNGYKHGCRNPYFEVCPLSNSVSYKPNHMTNADRIRAMSDEELAKMLWKTGRNYRAVCADPIVDFQEHRTDIIEWLKQPAEEGEQG